MTVDGDVDIPAAVSEPDMKLSLHPAPQYTSHCHWHVMAGIVANGRLNFDVFRSGMVPSLQSVVNSPRCLRSRPIQSESVLRTVPTSAYPKRYLGRLLLSWGIFADGPCALADCSDRVKENPSDYFVPYSHWFVTVGGYFTPGATEWTKSANVDVAS